MSIKFKSTLLSFVVEAIDDFAGLLTAEKRNLTDQEKFQLLTKDYTPSEKFVFPKTKIYGKSRSFQMSWLKEYTWLVYSPSKDGGLCRVCLVFPPSSNTANTGALVSFAMTKFNKANEILKEHSKTKYHNDALLQAENFIKMMRFPEKAIASVIESSRVAQIEHNSKVLRSIVSSVIFCGKQNIALRGHMESSADKNCKNRGNCLALLDFRAEAGDEIIAKHLRECARNATYTSATIQNNIIEITMEYLRNQIISEIPEHAAFFTILADETTDVSNTEQLCISIRFVNDTCSIHEEFLGFVRLARTTGEAVATSILEALQTWSLDVKNCRGQGYDGAASMSSAARGTQAFIRQKSPKAVYTHCNAHCLNLAIVHSCDIPMIRNMI